MPNSRITYLIDPFFSYVVITDNYFQITDPGAPSRLGLPGTVADNWHTRRLQADSLKILHDNVATKTKVVNKDVHDFIVDFHEFGQPNLNIMAASPNASNLDAQTFKFIIGHADPVHPTVAISDPCYALGHAMGGGNVAFQCRVLANASRPHLHSGSDGVQLAYKLGDPAPAGFDTGTQKQFFTKASFILSLGDLAGGQHLYVYARWYNSKHPELSGPWSLVQMIPVL
jgi:hypothetical protein